MTIKNTLIFTFIFLAFSFPNQVSARSSTSKIKKQVKTQSNISQRQIPSHIKRKALARRDLIRNYKKLSAKQKLHLLTSMVRTMAALELAHSRRRGRVSTNYHDSLFHPFWSLFIMRAYADDNSNTCFLGGHLVPTNEGVCDWGAARADDRVKCTFGGNPGVKCNSALFPSSPCVKDFKYGPRILNYSSTQACAYADAHNIKKHIEDGGRDLTNISVDPNIVSEQLNKPSLWASANPNVWVDERDKLLDGYKDAYALLLAGHDDGEIVIQLQEIKDRCESNVSNRFEKKHCDAFEKDLDHLGVIESEPSPGESEDDPSPGEEEGNDGCFAFHELPGEHFCQVRVATDRSHSEKDHLIVRLEGTINNAVAVIDSPSRNAVAVIDSPSRNAVAVIDSPSRNAVVYRLDNDKYCKDSGFKGKKAYSENTSNFWHPNEICGDEASHPASFSYFEVNLSIEKKNGNNMCKFNFSDHQDDQHLLIPFNLRLLKDSSKLSNFLPGVKVHCPYINIDDGIIPRGNDTHINCAQLKNKLNGPTNADKCIDPDVVALRDAASSLKHLEQCSGGQTLTIRIRKGRGEYQLLDDWLEDHQSLDDGTYEIKIQRKKPGSNNTWTGHYEFNSHLGDTDDQFPHGRKHRTISDWLYGNGKSVNDADEGGGLNGVVSGLCHRPQRTKLPPPPYQIRGTGSGGRPD